MNLTQQNEYLEKIFNQLKETLLKKGDDYAGEDRLSVFKTVGGILKTDSEDVCLNQIAIKVARLSNLLKSNSQPKNESIQDSVLDLIGYSLLMGMILEEKIKPIPPHFPRGESEKLEEVEDYLFY